MVHAAVWLRGQPTLARSNRSQDKRRRRLDFDAIIDQQDAALRLPQLRTQCTPPGDPRGAIVGLALVGQGSTISSLLDPIKLHERICMQLFGWWRGTCFASVLDAALVRAPISLSLAGHRSATLVKPTLGEQRVLDGAELFAAGAPTTVAALLAAWGLGDQGIPVWTMPASMALGVVVVVIVIIIVIIRHGSNGGMSAWKQWSH